MANSTRIDLNFQEWTAVATNVSDINVMFLNDPDKVPRKRTYRVKWLDTGSATPTDDSNSFFVLVSGQDGFLSSGWRLSSATDIWVKAEQTGGAVLI